jgi:hypothetical protein
MPLSAIRQAGREDAPPSRTSTTIWRAAYAGVVPAGHDGRAVRRGKHGIWRQASTASPRCLLPARRERTSAGAASLHPTRDAGLPGVGNSASFLPAAPRLWRSGTGRVCWRTSGAEAKRARFARLSAGTGRKTRGHRVFYEQTISPDGARQTCLSAIPLRSSFRKNAIKKVRLLRTFLHLTAEPRVSKGFALWRFGRRPNQSSGGSPPYP